MRICSKKELDKAKKISSFVKLTTTLWKRLRIKLLRLVFRKRKLCIYSCYNRDIGIVPNLSLLAFEKIPIKVYHELISSKLDDGFKDFQPPS